MIAKIVTENGYYDSIVFAIINKGWASEALVFNRDFTALQFVKVWKPSRNVFIYNAGKDGWVIKKKVEGYDWILENLKIGLFKRKIDESVLDKCKELQATIEERVWVEIKNEADIEDLMYASSGFHDSYVNNMYVDDGKQYISFDTTWGCDILFELDGNIETNLFESYGAITVDNKYLGIFDSAMFFQNNLVYWADDCSITSFEEIQKCKAHYFCAKHVKWKLIINESRIWGEI